MSINFSERILHEVIRANPIVDVVCALIPMHTICTNNPSTDIRHKNNCPFHKDDKESFHAFQGPRGTGYICYECGRSGDVVSFVMAYDELSFVQALQLLADKGSVQMNQPHHPKHQTTGEEA